MGCLKPSYRSDATLPKVMYGKSVLSEKSVQIWLSVDPMSDKYPSLSPYAYCMNNPVILVDPDGNYTRLGAILRNFFKKGQGVSYSVPTGEWGYQNNNRNICRYMDGLSTMERINRLNEYKKDHQFINNRWIFIPSINKADYLITFEMWLDSPSEDGFEAIEKIGANIAYSIFNSPYSLFTGKSLGGTSLNSKEKTDAFVDFAPGLIFGLFNIGGQVIKTTKGLQGYNKFVEKGIGITSTEGLPIGMKWQERAGHLFQNNKINQEALKDMGKGRNVLNGVNTINKEVEK